MNWLLKITQPIGNRLQIQTHTFWFQSYNLIHYIILFYSYPSSEKLQWNLPLNPFSLKKRTHRATLPQLPNFFWVIWKCFTSEHDSSPGDMADSANKETCILASQIQDVTQWTNIQSKKQYATKRYNLLPGTILGNSSPPIHLLHYNQLPY